jgi:hypothetical protein
MLATELRALSVLASDYYGSAVDPDLTFLPFRIR